MPLCAFCLHGLLTKTQIRFVDMDGDTLGAIKEQMKMVTEEREVWC